MGKLQLYVRTNTRNIGDFNADFNADFRRNFSYYTAVDLDDDDLVIYNYTLDDLNNPTIVRNSYSCTLTLPKTRNNNTAFGFFSRSDRMTADGFDASRKTPFIIYADNGKIIESGYLSLDKVTRNGYDVTLYGGLGSFFRALSVDEDGNARTMASLRYLPRRPYPKDVSFTINATTIKNAWAHILNGRLVNPLYSVINFAPCYNGVTDGFDADKILYKNGEYSNLPYRSIARNGYALATLKEPVNEWIVRDLRSYMQRPVLNVGKALDAISDPDNNGGWSVNWHGDFWFSRGSWVTLKMLQSNDKYSHTSVIEKGWNLRNQFTNIQKSNEVEMFGRTYSMLSGRTSAGLAEVSATVRVRARIDALGHYVDSDSKVLRASLFQVIGYNSSGEQVAVSKVYALTNRYPLDQRVDTFITNHIQPISGRLTADTPGLSKNLFYSAPNPEVTKIYGTYEDNLFTTTAESLQYVDIPISGYGIDSYEIRYKVIYENAGTATYDLDGSQRGITCVSNFSTGTDSWKYTPRFTDWELINESVTFSSIRSGAEVSKDDLLTTDYTPADFLISLARLNGWYFVADEAKKTVDIYSRDMFYNGEIEDISARVDMTTAKITPIAAESKYYEFAYPETYGGIAKDFEERTGRKYASIRVNTGYEFDDEPIEQMNGLIFKGAPMLTDRDKQYSTFRASDAITYFGWQMQPITYTFGDKATGTTDLVVEGKAPAAITAFNSKGVQYGDAISKVQLCDADGKSETGDGVLLWFDTKTMRGTASYQISDDTLEMLYQNENKPCYLLDAATGSNWLAPSQIPFFRRAYISNQPYNPNALIQNTWDMQAPTKSYDANFPNVDANGGVYAQYWGGLVHDRYNKDTRVVEVKTNLRGIAISYESFRKFYLFDGALWVLNKVKDYALNSDELTTCEFIKVQDTSNY